MKILWTVDSFTGFVYDYQQVLKYDFVEHNLTCRLILVSAPERPAYEFEGEVLSIGRAKDNNLVLADALVSRRHAELRKRGPGFIIVDMGSKNGVYVNNLKVSQEDLAHGDLILIGDAKLVFDSPIK